MTGLLTMPLDVFEQQGQEVEVRVPWWPEALYFVPAARDVAALTREGVARYRVWTAKELTAILTTSSLTTDALVKIMTVRRAFDGEVEEVWTTL